MEWLDRISAKKGAVGIEFLPEGLALAAKGCLGDARQVDVLHLLASEGEKFEAQKALDSFVHKHKIGRRLCHVILAARDYQLLLVEAPEVPPEDLREAVRWRIKDLISMPVEKAVLDVFFLPADANRSSKKMLYVAVANIERIQSIMDLVNSSGLTLSSIDVPEMALRNLGVILAGSAQERGVGIVRIHRGGGVLCLYREGNLYLSRQFKLQYNAGLLDDLPEDALGLELQRSLDYYERQMGMTPPAALYLCGENISADKITSALTRAITVPLHFLNLADSFSYREAVDEGMGQVCLAALGAVLREEVLR